LPFHADLDTIEEELPKLTIIYLDPLPRKDQPRLTLFFPESAI